MRTLSCRFNADVFIRFLARLLKSTDGRKIILIIDSHPAHKAAKVTRWIEAKRGRQAKLELCFMPGYSPELNPDELLNQDTKQGLQQNLWVRTGSEYLSSRSPRGTGIRVVITQRGEPSARRIAAEIGHSIAASAA